MALRSSITQRRSELSYAGREITIVAAAQAEGNAFMSILQRGRKTFTLLVNPSEYGLHVGSYVERGDQEMLAGRVVKIWDNEQRDDWFSDATEWYVTVERPWMQTELSTSLGACKVEWLEDKLFPRVGTIISTPDDSYFMMGDIVRIQ